MKKLAPMRFAQRGFVRLLPLACVFAAGSASAHSPSSDPVVGTWLVEQPAAPFPLHLYVFNADQTMQQANPDAGDPRTSDSDGKGAWRRKDGKVSGKWVEIMADRLTHKLTGRGEFTYEIDVAADNLTGTGTFLGYAADGKVFVGPIAAPFTGTRVTAP